MENTSGDLYANANSNHYLRIDGIGWQVCPESELPDMDKFWPLHAKQKEAYWPALQDAGLV